jgi:hypothetical protein
LQLHAQGWLRDAAAGRCAHKLAVRVEGNEVLKLLQIHYLSINVADVVIKTNDLTYGFAHGKFV